MGTFFIPANIGAQEGGLQVVAAGLTGDPNAGLALAVVRRIRDLVFILWGLALAWRDGITPRTVEAAEDADAGAGRP